MSGRGALAVCVLGPLENLFGSPQEHAGVVVTPQFDEAGMEPDTVVAVVDSLAQRELKPPVEALGVRLPRLRHDHGEEPVSEMGRYVGAPDGAADPFSGRGMVAQTAFGLEENQPERALVSARTGALAPQAFVEVAAVAQVGERIGISQSARLLVEACVLEGRPERRGELLEVG
jgi:hypothetical protein